MVGACVAVDPFFGEKFPHHGTRDGDVRPLNENLKRHMFIRSAQRAGRLRLRLQGARLLQIARAERRVYLR